MIQILPFQTPTAPPPAPPRAGAGVAFDLAMAGVPAVAVMAAVGDDGRQTLAAPGADVPDRLPPSVEDRSLPPVPATKIGYDHPISQEPSARSTATFDLIGTGARPVLPAPKDLEGAPLPSPGGAAAIAEPDRPARPSRHAPPRTTPPPTRSERRREATPAVVREPVDDEPKLEGERTADRERDAPPAPSDAPPTVTPPSAAVPPAAETPQPLSRSELRAAPDPVVRASAHTEAAGQRTTAPLIEPSLEDACPPEAAPVAVPDLATRPPVITAEAYRPPLAEVASPIAPSASVTAPGNVEAPPPVTPSPVVSPAGSAGRPEVAQTPGVNGPAYRTEIAPQPATPLTLGTEPIASTERPAAAPDTPVPPTARRAERTGVAVPPPVASPGAARPASATAGPAAQVFAAEIRRASRDAWTPALPEPVAPVPAEPVVATAEPAPAVDVRQERWPQAMVERIERLRDDVAAADTRVRLSPDALGTIDLAVRRDGDTVHVRFTAAEPATAALLADAAHRLAEAAEARGLKLGGTTVEGGGADRDGRPAHQPPAPSTTRSRSAPAVAPAAEGAGARIA